MSAINESDRGTEIVTRSASGKLTWASTEVRNEAILAQLKRDGYTVKISTEHLGRKYYIARAGSVISNQVERAFVSQAQLNKYVNEWNRYSHPYTWITIVYRDEILNRAADYILNR